MNTHVSDLLQRKGPRLVTIHPDATVYDAIETMVDNDVGAIVVVDGSELMGIFTERDYLKRIALRGRTSRNTRVGDVMSTHLCCVEPDDTIETCMSRMTNQRMRHLLVLDGQSILGLVSIGDCVAHLCDELTVENGYLREYIMGKYPG